MKTVLGRLNWGPLVKWPLLVLVVVLIIVNYYAFTEILLGLLEQFNHLLNSYGYYFDVTKPFFVLLNIGVPSLGVVGYVVTLNSKNVGEVLHQIYGEATVLQLMVLVIVLPMFLFVQNKIYSDHILTYDRK